MSLLLQGMLAEKLVPCICWSKAGILGKEGRDCFGGVAETEDAVGDMVGESGSGHHGGSCGCCYPSFYVVVISGNCE